MSKQNLNEYLYVENFLITGAGCNSSWSKGWNKGWKADAIWNSPSVLNQTDTLQIYFGPCLPSQEMQEGNSKITWLKGTFSKSDSSNSDQSLYILLPIGGRGTIVLPLNKRRWIPLNPPSLLRKLNVNFINRKRIMDPLSGWLNELS